MIDVESILPSEAPVRIVESANARPYAVVETATGRVVDKITWDADVAQDDPAHQYDPGPGRILIELDRDSPVYPFHLSDEGIQVSGWTYVSDAFQPPAAA